MTTNLICCKYAPIIKVIYEDMEKIANKILSEDGITLSQAQFLVYLLHSDDSVCSLKELEKQFHVSQATTAGITSRLEAKGFIEIFKNKEDKRSKKARLTERGSSVAKGSVESLDGMEDYFFSCLSIEEKEQLHSMLKKVYDHLFEGETK